MKKHHTKTQAQKKWIKTHLSTLYKAHSLNYVILSKLILDTISN